LEKKKTGGGGDEGSSCLETAKVKKIFNVQAHGNGMGVGISWKSVFVKVCTSIPIIKGGRVSKGGDWENGYNFAGEEKTPVQTHGRRRVALCISSPCEKEKNMQCQS